MHIGKFVFAQITQFLPQRYFNRVVAKYNDRTRGWSMSHWNHLLVLMFGQLMGCGSLTATRIFVAISFSLARCRGERGKREEREAGIGLSP